ncbi:replicative helicase loader/inhibitor [Virgibacillus alimentarius]|uniref:Replicative helicase inhibitor G39P N-terminal domain-containing protein n=1 Tax=Virgibacillus alimentarius TaxID=698769 RepID=A0ABS4S695_9BACI|nr:MULTISPECIES: replicative helicase loader/inhibitor [Virgibacillus]MBP2257037.1 hypothetical protein [Virgibacillus alimentarius]HLR69663.1 replicative helicase loader/inhibitor [Virgibacillus sp.]
MNKKEAIYVLEAIRDIYPKFDISKRKAEMLLPQLEQMNYAMVMQKLATYVANNPYPPTIAEIAAYKTNENDHLKQMKIWRKEADKVPNELKQRFHQQMISLLREKSHESNR